MILYYCCHALPSVDQYLVLCLMEVEMGGYSSEKLDCARGKLFEELGLQHQLKHLHVILPHFYISITLLIIRLQIYQEFRNYFVCTLH